MDQYGGELTPDLRSGSFTTNNVTVRITTGGGTTMKLSPEEVKQLVARIQAELRKQAERNKKRKDEGRLQDGPLVAGNSVVAPQ